MNSSIKIAGTVFIRSFYLENASFFLLVLGIAGGFMRDVEHVALAEFFVSRIYLLLIPYAFWILYGFKILRFNATCLQKPENQFFYQLIFFSRSSQFLISGLVVVTQLVPALLYGFFLIATAAKYSLYDSLMVIVGCLGSLALVLVFHVNRLIRKPNQDKRTSSFIRMINRLIVRPYPLFSIEWLSRKKTLMLLGTKVFCILILLAVSKLYTTDQYDLRLMGMALTIVVGASAQIMFEIHRFDNYHFALARQLPIPFVRRMGYLLLTVILILIPEAGILVTYYPAELSSIEMVEGLLFLVAGLVFWYGLLYRRDIEQEVLTKIVFACTMLAIVLILFKVPLWGLATIAFLLAVFWSQKHYYRFEYSSTTL